jgi:hypothetical protein
MKSSIDSPAAKITSVAIGQEYINPSTGVVAKAIGSSFFAICLKVAGESGLSQGEFDVSNETFNANWVQFVVPDYI